MTSGRGKPHCGFNVLGRRISPELPEKIARKCPGVLDAALSARGRGGNRRVVMFLVLKEGLILPDVEPLLREHFNLSSLKEWQKPRGFSQVEYIPKNGLGQTRRDWLNRGSFVDRRFRLPQRKLGLGKVVTITLREPINRIEFEGVIAQNPMWENRNTLSIQVSHCEPGAKAVKRKFRIIGNEAKKYAELAPGTRVVVYAKFGHGSVLLIDEILVEGQPGAKRVALAKTEDVIERLM